MMYCTSLVCEGHDFLVACETANGLNYIVQHLVGEKPLQDRIFTLPLGIKENKQEAIKAL